MYTIQYIVITYYTISHTRYFQCFNFNLQLRYNFFPKSSVSVSGNQRIKPILSLSHESYNYNYRDTPKRGVFRSTWRLSFPLSRSATVNRDVYFAYVRVASRRGLHGFFPSPGGRSTSFARWDGENKRWNTLDESHEMPTSHTNRVTSIWQYTWLCNRHVRGTRRFVSKVNNITYLERRNVL